MKFKFSEREKKLLKRRLEDVSDIIKKEQFDIVSNIISEEKNSIHVVNTCFQPFISSNNSQFLFYRTDPLHLSKIPNFDIALSSPDTICLIECKSNLGTNLTNAVTTLQQKIDFVEKNKEINTGERRIRIKDYFAEKLQIEDPRFYYVLASEIVDLGISPQRNRILEDLIDISKYPFDIWSCQWCTSELQGIKITRNPIPSFRDRERPISIKSLANYLQKTHLSEGKILQICLSSNKMYLAMQCCTTLKLNESFTFDEFLTSFSIDLKDYEDFEKEYLFQHFIGYGKECGLIKVIEDTRDIFTSSYAVINRNMKSKQLPENIIHKIVSRKIEGDLGIQERMKQEVQTVTHEIFYQREPKQKRLDEFTD